MPLGKVAESGPRLPEGHSPCCHWVVVSGTAFEIQSLLCCQRSGQREWASVVGQKTSSCDVPDWDSVLGSGKHPERSRLSVLRSEQRLQLGPFLPCCDLVQDKGVCVGNDAAASEAVEEAGVRASRYPGATCSLG